MGPFRCAPHHLLEYHLCDACERRGDVGMMFAECSFANSERPFVEELGLVEFALHFCEYCCAEAHHMITSFSIKLARPASDPAT